jgi:ubiquinone/menaquinone biosynthesis C-methylase UbiE
MDPSEPDIQTNDPHPKPDAGQFIEIAPLYDTLMTGVPYQEWVAYLRKLLSLRNASPRHVLDLACGTGNVSELLAAQGMKVNGVDIAPAMIAEARRKAAGAGLDIDFFVQDAAELDLPGRRFDLCVSLFDSLNYILEPERLEMAMERVAAHLTPNGLFIFDLNSEYALRNHFFDQNNMNPAEPLRYHWVSDYFPDTHLCRVRMTFWRDDENGDPYEFEEVHWQYAYAMTDVVDMLTRAGFEDITPYQAYTLRAPARASDRIYYIARRP